MSGWSVDTGLRTSASQYPLGHRIGEQALVDDPYPIYLRLQQEEPISWIAPLNMWWVVGYRDVVEILNDTDHFTTASPNSTIQDTFGLQMLSAEGDIHARYKRAAMPAFQPTALRRALEADIVVWTDDLISRLPDRGADIRKSFAALLPIRTMIGLFGLPLQNLPDIRRWYDDFEAALANFAGDQTVRRSAHASVLEFHGLLAQVLAEVRAGRQEGLLGHLVQQGLSDEEIVRNASIIMFGGISTVEALILNSLWALAMHPETDARVRADRSLLTAVIEEVLRWQSPVQSATRHVVKPIDYRGHRFEAGDTVNCMIAAANRDPILVSDPDLFDIDRRPQPRHLAFASGPHFCLGFRLAKLQARIALDRLYGRLEGFAVIEPSRHRPRGYEFRQPRSLPVVWDDVSPFAGVPV